MKARVLALVILFIGISNPVFSQIDWCTYCNEHICDSICRIGESSACPDCSTPISCGDNICDIPDQECSTCPSDCGAGDQCAENSQCLCGYCSCGACSPTLAECCSNADCTETLGGFTCDGGQCVTRCGNGYCESSESITSCPEDCAQCDPRLSENVCCTSEGSFMSPKEICLKTESTFQCPSTACGSILIEEYDVIRCTGTSPLCPTGPSEHMEVRTTCEPTQKCDLSQRACVTSQMCLPDTCDDLDGDGHFGRTTRCTAGTDCDDSKPGVNPGATEICDRVDNDCNQATQDGSGESWIGKPCDGPDSDLCAEGIFSCSGGSKSCSDSTGNNEEVCNNADDDCDGHVDEGLLSTFYRDSDGDGFGDPKVSVNACSKPTGHVTDAKDCDDAKAKINPDALEDCRDSSCLDEDCDGLSNAEDTGSCPSGGSSCVCMPPSVICSGRCVDTRSDILNCGSCANACEVKPEWKTTIETISCQSGKCTITCRTGYKDMNGDISDGCETACGAEICDGVDNDCDRLIDEGFDDDHDGVCSTATGGLDCDDANPGIKPDAPEVCDGKDNNCDSRIDETCDDDKDGFCRIGKTILQGASCQRGEGDCNDANAKMNPGMVEACDGIDNNCMEGIDEGCSCEDGKVRSCGETDVGECSLGRQTCTSGRWSSCQGSILPKAEVCDGKDNNCDGGVDELGSCCIPGQAIPCIPEGDCTRGSKICQNYVWSKCKEECSLSVSIIQPMHNRVYNTQTIPVRIRISQDSDCSYMLSDKEGRMTERIVLGGGVADYAKASEGRNTLTVVCEDKQASVDFTVDTASFSFRKVIENSSDSYRIIDDVASSTPDPQVESLKELAQKTSDVTDQELGVQKSEGRTTLTSSVIPKNELKNTTVYLSIPKCLAERVDELEFVQDDYEIIKEDPLVAFHFVEVKDRIDLTYEVDKDIPEDCLEQIRALPIAGLIAGKLHKKPFLQSLLPLLLVPIIAYAVIHFAKYGGKRLTKEEFERRVLQRRYRQLAKSYSAFGKERAKRVLEEEGYTEKEAEEVIRYM